MKWFAETITNVTELRTAFKKLLLKYHPDNNKGQDTTPIMQEINNEYDTLFSKLKDKYEKSPDYENQSDRQKQSYDWEKDENIRHIITELARFEGVIIEICGTWIYVSGNTYPYKKELKALGLTWNRIRECWIIYFDDYYQYHKIPVSMSYIRSKYGSVIINTDKEEKNRRISVS